MKQIAILDDYASASLDCADWPRLSGYEPVVYTDNLVEHDALAERLKDFEIVCIMRERTPFPAAMFERLPNLKLLVTSGMRNKSLDMAAAKSHGVLVCGTESPGHATSEHAWGLIHAVARNIAHDDRVMKEGGWQTRTGVDLKGKNLGVLGLGKQGGKVAAVAPHFGMNLIAWSQNMTAEKAAEHGAKLLSKEEFFKQSDFITVHVLQSERTIGLIGKDEFALMKPTARLINTSRGPIVDQTALINALNSGQIAGAAVDVFDVEPLPVDSPLRSLENLIMTPHTGYVTKETYETFYGQMVDAIEAWAGGAPIRVLNGD